MAKNIDDTLSRYRCRFYIVSNEWLSCMVLPVGNSFQLYSHLVRSLN